MQKARSERTARATAADYTELPDSTRQNDAGNAGMRHGRTHLDPTQLRNTSSYPGHHHPGGRAHRQPGKTLPALITPREGTNSLPLREGKLGLVWVAVAGALALQSRVGENWAWGRTRLTLRRPRQSALCSSRCLPPPNLNLGSGMGGVLSYLDHSECPLP